MNSRGCKPTESVQNTFDPCGVAPLAFGPRAVAHGYSRFVPPGHPRTFNSHTSDRISKTPLDKRISAIYGPNQRASLTTLAFAPMSKPKQFSQRSQKVLLLANCESKRLRSLHVASEHLLLGALAYRSSAVSGTLKSAGLTLHTLRSYILRVGSAPEDAPHGYGPSMQGALRRSYQHAVTLSHDEIEPEHLVLGVLGEMDGGAARALRHFRVNVRAAKRQIIQKLRW